MYQATQNYDRRKINFTMVWRVVLFGKQSQRGRAGQRNWNWHNLRHRRASIWHNKEKRPLYEVMVLLGHSNIKTTQGYLQLIS